MYVHIYYSHRRSSQTKHKSKWQHITWHQGNQQFTSVYYLPHPICTSRPHPTSQCMGTPRCVQYNTVQRGAHVILFKRSYILEPSFISESMYLFSYEKSYSHSYLCDKTSNGFRPCISGNMVSLLLYWISTLYSKIFICLCIRLKHFDDTSLYEGPR